MAEGQSYTSPTRYTHVLLLGKTGSGKSATGNSILGDKYFGSKSGGESVTSKSEVAGGEVLDHHVLVVDTPGTMDTNDPNGALSDIATALLKLDNQVHAFLIVMSYRPNLTETDMISWQKLKGLMGPEFLKFALIVFTEGDNYDKEMSEDDDKSTFKEYIRKYAGEKLRQILDDCGWRYTLFNNYAVDDVRQVQNFELLEKIDDVKNKNQIKCFCSKYPGRMAIKDGNDFDVLSLYNPSPEEIAANVEPMKKEECFPADAVVTLSTGAEVKMEDLEVGDKVLSMSGTGSVFQTEVFLFGHALQYCKATFVCLKTATRLLRLTEGHFIYTLKKGNCVPKAAKDLVVGDVLLILKDGRCVPEEVTSISWSEERGLYAPFTMSGSVIVDGVLASCYVDLLSAEMAHSLMWPVRQMYKISPTMLRVVSKTGKDGIPQWINWILKTHIF